MVKIRPTVDHPPRRNPSHSPTLEVHLLQLLQVTKSQKTPMMLPIDYSSMFASGAICGPRFAHNTLLTHFSRLSIKQASEKYGPFLPPDDGSPFLAHRLHRLWDDLSKEQQLEYYARAATEINSESVEVSQKSSRPYSPQLRSASSGYASPTFGAGSAARTRFSPYEIPEHHHMSTHTPEMRSPVFSNDDDPSCGSVRSRSQSPAGEDGQPHSSHVPRPPNAWILFR